jgi:farnesyl diphosphate synthase
VNLKQQINAAQNRLDTYISNYFSLPLDTDETVKSATFYSINNGGKRLRPFLVYTVGRLLGANEADLDVAAAAIECIHSYSLVHDDLPAMDDDDLRRGKPTCHIAYDEAQAILAGDALQTLAFEFLSRHEFSVSAKQQIKMINTLAVASGLQGMVGGQALDIAATDKSITIEELERIHKLKTGALLNCAIQLGALCAHNVEAQTISALDSYGKNLGLAFQVQDDILDIEGDTAVLGKPQGSDLDNHKSTYPALLGLDGAKHKAHQLVEDALSALDTIPHNTDVLAELAKYIIERDH